MHYTDTVTALALPPHVSPRFTPTARLPGECRAVNEAEEGDHPLPCPFRYGPAPEVHAYMAVLWCEP